MNGGAPTLRLVDPRNLLIEGEYQRDLSAASVNLIRRIVAGFEWAKFKPPVCAETPLGLFVIDGQHTAIAAATHGGIREIPVMVTSATHLAQRADAFVAHNRDRLNMTQAQILYAEAAAGGAVAKAILQIVTAGGATIPRLPIAKAVAKPGQATAVGELRAIYGGTGPAALKRVIRVAVLAKSAPISNTVLRALRILLCDESMAPIAAMKDEAIAAALASVRDIDKLPPPPEAPEMSRFRIAAAEVAKRLGFKVEWE